MTTADAAIPGRHQRTKDAHRRAIADAAVALAQEFGPRNFTADQLADKADVARRTIFNHFASIDDAIYAGLGQTLEAAVEEFTEVLAATKLAAQSAPPPGESSRASDTGLDQVFDDLGSAILDVDVVPTLSQVVVTVASREDVDDLQTSHWAAGVLGLIIPLLEAEVEARASQTKRSSRALLVRSLISALTVAFDEWYELTDGIDNANSRVVWRDTLESALRFLRSGFASPSAL